MKIINELSKTQKARILSLFFLNVLLVLNVLGYANGLKNAQPVIEYVDEVEVDGEDFSPIANLFIGSANGFFQFITIVFMIFSMLLISLILLVPWRCIALRKNSIVSEKEYKISLIMFGVFIIISLVSGLAVTRLSNILIVGILVFIPSLLILLFCVLPFRVKYKQQMPNNTYNKIGS